MKNNRFELNCLKRLKRERSNELKYSKMYHERQSRQMCLVHALNALFQKPHFTSESLDEICYSLNESRWFNPHRSMLGLGNYDANVLMSALAMYDYQVSKQNSVRLSNI
ncbi:hypothetical protein V3C99_017251 [Haemonchus contortus]